MSSESALRFHSYEVSQFHYVKNPHYDMSRTESLPLEYSFSGDAEIDEALAVAIITLSCDIFKEDFSVHQVPFYLSVTLKGNFGLQGETDISQFRINSVAILLPYLRSILTSFTAQAGISPVIIPVMNVYKLFQDSEGSGA